VKHVLRLTLAVAALQLFAAAASSSTASAGGASADASAGRRSAMSQASGKGSKPAHAGGALAPGVWGGEHIRFEVTERGADVEYDCAHGTVEGRIVVDRRGRFSVSGMHYEEHGGPSRPGGDAAGYRVRLSGVVGGSLLKLTVTRAGTRRVVGRFSLARDREANVVKCR
jgi:hypothetical protein